MYYKERKKDRELGIRKIEKLSILTLQTFKKISYFFATVGNDRNAFIVAM